MNGYGYYIGAETARERQHRELTEAWRANATATVQRHAVGAHYFGFRYVPTGGELTIFTSPEGLEAWWQAQLRNERVPYAVRFTVVDPNVIVPSHERSRF